MSLDRNIEIETDLYVLKKMLKDCYALEICKARIKYLRNKVRLYKTIVQKYENNISVDKNTVHEEKAAPENPPEKMVSEQ